MSSLFSATQFSQDYLLLHSHYRRLLFHIPLHKLNPEANLPTTINHQDKLDPYSGKSTYDANVIVILSLLVCALICAIGLNFIVRCALKYIRSTPAVTGISSAQKPNTGIEKKALKTFTILKYTEGIKLPGLGSDCVICLSEFKPGEKVRVLPKCNHGFHVRCIDKWLGRHSSCPTCRNCLSELSQKIVLPAPAPEARETVLSIAPL